MSPDTASPTPRAAGAFSEGECAWLLGELQRAVGRVCPQWLAGHRDDLVQAGLMRVMEIRRKSEGNQRFSTSYLRKVAYSALVDEIRRRRRKQEVSLDNESQQDGWATARPGPDRRSAGREIGRAIRHCLTRQVRARRLAVTLHLQGHAVPEVGRLLGHKPKQADNLVYRGLADLRRCLAAKGVTP